MEWKIRQETEKDYEMTEKVVKRAFLNAEYSDQSEHRLVSRLRKSEAFIPELSFVAVKKKEDEIIGHILLSKISIQTAHHAVESLAMAPVSVIPEAQMKGIGKSLIEEGLKKAQALGYQSVIVLGHPTYYCKFGFKKASLWGIKAPFDVPDDAFMAIELKEDALHGVSGVVEYPSVFFE